jgi:histidinol phosphatase-like enzyme
MGNNSSSQIKKEDLKKEAIRKFNIRINRVYAHHGNHFKYIQWCRAKYKLDCIDTNCYKPQYDHW